MNYEVISFKTFMDGPAIGSSIYPDPSIFHMVDGGLTFFCGLGVTLLGLIVLEKLGVQIDEKMVRWFMWAGVLVFFGIFLLKNPLWSWF